MVLLGDVILMDSKLSVNLQPKLPQEVFGDLVKMATLLSFLLYYSNNNINILAIYMEYVIRVKLTYNNKEIT